MLRLGIQGRPEVPELDMNCLYSLKALQHLDLEGLYTGNITLRLSELKQLEYLRLATDDNNWVGVDWAALQALEVVDIWSEQLCVSKHADPSEDAASEENLLLIAHRSYLPKWCGC